MVTLAGWAASRRDRRGNRLTLLPEFLRMLASWTHYEKLTEWRMTIYSLL
jgi:hypothetical protein